MENSPDQSSDVLIRHPRAADAAGVWELVEQIPNLDKNSPYAYLLLCSDFASSGAIAESEGRIVGFVVGYRRPAQPESLFVWQVGVHPDQRKRGLGQRMLSWLMAHAQRPDARFLEATVTPSNTASWKLFEKTAIQLGVPCRRLEGFPSSLFPVEDHEDEVLVRIGPVGSRSPEPSTP